MCGENKLFLHYLLNKLTPPPPYPMVHPLLIVVVVCVCAGVRMLRVRVCKYLSVKFCLVRGARVIVQIYAM